MICVQIVSKGLSENELEAVKKLAEAAIGSGARLTVVDVVQPPADNCEDEFVIIVLSEPNCSDGELDEQFVQAQNGGMPAICVWPEGASPVDPPPAARNYSYSIVPHDIGKLKAVFADDDTTVFEFADGQTLPKVDTERNLCVEEKGAKK